MMAMVKEFFCPACKEKTLEEKPERMECPGCESHFPIVDGIPVFEGYNSIGKWTEYHTNGSDRISEGRYASEQPSAPTEYYSQFIPDGAVRVLDVGGGDGNTTADWAQRHPEATVYVADLSLHGLRKIERRGIRNMIPVCTSADVRFPFPDGFFDVVSTVFMIEHLADEALSRFYAEARRLLRFSGTLVVATDTRFYDSIVHPLERLLRKGKYVPNDPTHINLTWPERAKRQIEASGFRVEGKRVHMIAGRHVLAQKMYGMLPRGFAEKYLSTMFILSARK
jgi:SAM-dependent methyltransferase